MKYKVLVFVYLLCATAFSQNTIFKVEDKDWEVSPKILLNNSKDKKFKIKFASLENGNYFVINRLLYGNKTAKAMAYFKEFDVYVVREAFNLKYYAFKEAFPKGGFYKDGGLKTIFGQKAERYSLDNDVLDFKIWITDGVQEPNEFVGFLKNMGLLRNLPTTKKVIALNIQGLELELTDLKLTTEKGRIASNLEDFLVSFKEKEDALTACLQALPKDTDSVMTEFSTSVTKNFPYKITQNSTYVDRFDKKTQNQTATVYSSADGMLQVHLYEKENKKGLNAQLYDYKLMKVYEGEVVEDAIRIVNATKLATTVCEAKPPMFVVTLNNINYYVSGKESKFQLVRYELDEKNYPNFFNWNFKNGFIKSYYILDKYLNQETVRQTLESGTFTFKLSK